MAQKKKTKRTGRHAMLYPGMNYIKSVQFRKSMEESVEDYAKSDIQRVLADRQAQRMSWIYLISLEDRFGFDKDRIQQLEATVKEMTDDYNRMVREYDQDYTDEKLRESVSKLRGYEVKYLYEDQYPVNPERKEEQEDPEAEVFSSLRESETRIY